jgi:hypothetical protein
MFCYIFVYNYALVVICGVAVLENCVECTDNETQVKLNALYYIFLDFLRTRRNRN